MLAKMKPIVDKELLKTYVGKECILTNRNDTHAHHRCKRSRIRMDIPENLVPLSDYINGALEGGYKAFITSLDFIRPRQWTFTYYEMMLVSKFNQTTKNNVFKIKGVRLRLN